MFTARVSLVLPAVLAAAWAFAQPAPSFQGPTGLIAIPTTEVVAKNQSSAVVGVYTDADVTVVAANYGVSNRAEVGFTRLEGPQTTLNAKYAWRQQEGNRPAISFGVLDLTDQVDPTLYGVAGKTFTMQNTGSFSNLRGYAGLAVGSHNNGLFAGASVRYQENWQLMAEYDTENVNFGARYFAPRGLMGTVAAIDAGEEIAIGVSYVKQF